ncbi:right-handed parallel beta-helix repeat-containing protein [Paenibacillus sp. HB172176]|uniref:right-handed parallel beta-helix repeat-containing protein n=1 Tax=Paenibacillus sp. HB172176 TaxID=2493690 RepID=UPI0014392C61|nr:right-handed parallel beta-helix repeat-containing protein [Paenibacillus sp. HB172176]
MKRRSKSFTAALLAACLTVWLMNIPAGAVFGDELDPMESGIQTAYYVSPDGDDDNPGTEALPFATLQKAQLTVRSVNDEMTGDIVVYLRGGSYTLDSAWQLDEADSGTEGYSVIYRAYEDEKPVIEGGRDISGWTLYDAVNDIYAASAEDLETRQLYVNGNRAVRARMEGGLTNGVKNASGYESDDAWLAGLDKPSDVEAVFKAAWTSPRIRVQSIGELSGKAEITLNPALWPSVMNRSHLEQWYLENAYEFLDQPGEWYLDDTAETIYYKPRPGENMATATVTASVLENLLGIDGGSLDTPANHIRFEGIGFAYSTWMQPTDEEGWIDEQNNYKIGTLELPQAAVQLQYAQHITFERCDFSRLGGTGLNMLEGVQDTLVEGNRFYDISGSAINAGITSKKTAEVYNPTDTRKILKNNDILNNYIHDVAVEYKSATAVTVAFPMDIDISHNEIFNIPYSGISFFGSVYAPVTTTVNAKVQDNFIHHLMGDGIFDGGAIYAFGVTGGTEPSPNLISGNYIKDQLNRYATIYMDQSSNYWKIEQNVVELKDIPIWDDIYETYWAFTNINTNHIVLNDNYSTTASFWNKSSVDSIVKTNDHIYPNAAWPTEAQAIIANAGLQEAYQDIAEGNIEILDVPASLNLTSEDTYALSIQAETGHGASIDLSSAQTYYASRDAAVATVNSSGLITAVDSGHTQVVLYIYFHNRLLQKTIEVYVDDELDDIEVYYALENVKHVMPESMTFVPGSSRQLVARGITRNGQIIGGGDVSVTSSNPSVTSVVYGLMTTLASGTADLTFTTSLNGVAVSKEIEINVVDFSDEDSLTFPAYSLNKAIRDPRNWYSRLASGTITPGEGQLDINTPGSGYAMYEDQTFGDELLSMNMKINATGGWPSIVLRSQKADKDFTASDNSLYMICFKANIIELHRFSGGDRTVFFGEIAGFDSLGAASYPNTSIPFHETHFVQAGAVTEAGGVRIILNVDGENVFTYLDASAERITEDGYFGLYARSGSITLSETDLDLPGEDEWPIPEAPSASLDGTDRAITDENVTLTGSVIPNSALTLEHAEFTYDPDTFELEAVSSLADGMSIAVTEAVYGTVQLEFTGTGTELSGYDAIRLFAATFKAKTAAASSDIELTGISLTDRDELEVVTAPAEKSILVSALAAGGLYESFDAYADGMIGGTSGYIVTPSDLGYFTIQESPTEADKSLHLYKTSTTDAATSTLSKIYSAAGIAGQVSVSYQVKKESGIESPQSFVNLRDTTGKVIATIIVDSTLRFTLDSSYTLVDSAHMLEDMWYGVTLHLDFDNHTVSAEVRELEGENRVWTLEEQAMQNELAANFSRAEYVLWKTRTGAYSYNNLLVEGEGS